MQYRRKLQCLMNGRGVKSWHCIQVKSPGNRSWLFLRDQTGIVKFATAGECDARIEALQAKQAPQKTAA